MYSWNPESVRPDAFVGGAVMLAQITPSYLLIIVVSKKITAELGRTSLHPCSLRQPAGLDSSRTRLGRDGGCLAHHSHGGAHPRAAHRSLGGARLHTSRAPPA